MVAVLHSVYTRAEKLAAWSKLPDGDIGNCYINVRLPQAPVWEVVVATAPAAALKLAACKAAQDGGFLDQLANSIANWEQRMGRPADDIVTMLDDICHSGFMQGMTDQQRGFMRADILLPLVQARDACAIVFRTGPASEQQLGTAFLVRPDMVLTAAHVVMDISDDGRQWKSELKSGLAFRFRARPNQPQQNLVEVKPASNAALVSFALPYGEPPNHLSRSLDAVAAEYLDYALIRLEQRVNHLSPVNVADHATVKQGRPCWAFGYPGGNALMMDVDVVTEVNADSGRWLHCANSAEGMSGGCCVNHEGEVVGLHEGTLEIARSGVRIRRNRGISIGAIRNVQRRGGKDPLAQAASAPGLEFEDAALVDGWYRAGQLLAGDAGAGAWRASVRAALGGLDPEDTAALPEFHPWFARGEVEKWIDSPDPAERLCLVHGEPGVGKSFCIHLLRGKLDPYADLVVFNPTQTNDMSWRDATGQASAADASDYRTAAATVRYRAIDSFLGELRERSANGARTCYVAIDFGPEGRPDRFAGSSWVELVATLAAAGWIRVLLIGLDPYERSVIIERLEARPETEDVAVTESELRPITATEFRTYAKQLAAARGKKLKEAQLSAFADKAIAAGVPAPMAMVTAVRAAIELEAALR